MKKFRNIVRAILRILPDKLHIKITYFLTFGRVIKFKEPIYWTEMIQIKKLKDRKQIITDVADKVMLREFVVNRLGKDITPELLWVGDNADSIPFESLPESFVVKTNHGVGTNIIVSDKNKINYKKIISQLENWLTIDFYYPEKEWGYKNIPRKILIEKLLLNSNYSIPTDVKLYMFNGNLGAINIHNDRFTTKHQNLLLNSDFISLEDEMNYESLKPEKFDEILRYAQELSKGFDFIRVDFYELDNQIALGELTHYPVGGFKRMKKETDLYLGSLWKKFNEEKI